jgi:hypothetical protein
MKGLEAISDLRFNISYSQDMKYKENNDLCDIIEKEIKAFEFVANNIRVGIDTNKDIHYACLSVCSKDFDGLFVIRDAYEESDPETYKQLLALKEVLENVKNIQKES